MPASGSAAARALWRFAQAARPDSAAMAAPVPDRNSRRVEVIVRPRDNSWSARVAARDSGRRGGDMFDAPLPGPLVDRLEPLARDGCEIRAASRPLALQIGEPFQLATGDGCAGGFDHIHQIADLPG